MSTIGGTPVKLEGFSGTIYPHSAYSSTSSWSEVAGNYAILKVEGGRWIVLYVGETDNLQKRMAAHHRMNAFIRNGWTHLAFRFESSSLRRTLIERDLMARYKPVCNREV
jgi:hypothetical protein